MAPAALHIAGRVKQVIDLLGNLISCLMLGSLTRIRANPSGICT